MLKIHKKMNMCLIITLLCVQKAILVGKVFPDNGISCNERLDQCPRVLQF